MLSLQQIYLFGQILTNQKGGQRYNETSPYKGSILVYKSKNFYSFLPG